MWMKTAKVSIQDKYMKTSFTKLSNIFSNLNEISRKIQQMHLRFVCKMAVILCGPQYITCVQWLCLRQNSRHVSNWIVKENTKALSKEINLITSVKWQPHCLGLKVLKNIVAKTKCSLFGRVCFQRTLFLNLGVVWIQFGAIWINLKTLSAKWRSHCLGLWC